MKRTIALILIIICLAGGAAACSAAGPSGPHGGGSRGGGAPGSQAGGTEQVMTVMRQLAHCIRGHGMPGWPDPNALGEFPLTTQMSIQYKVADRPAANACIRYVPGGTQYLQFVGTAAPQAASGGSGHG